MHYAMTVDIDRPIDEVWAWMGDPFNTPRLRGITLGARQDIEGGRLGPARPTSCVPWCSASKR